MAVQIAIVDSGINPWHCHVQGVAGGICLQLDMDRQIVSHDDFRDSIGHGTAIAGVIREKAPLAELFAVKIFQHELRAPIELLLAGLNWAIARRVKLIHLSLGTEHERFKADLETLCRTACDQGSVIVAAARAADDTVYPASLPSVIGVYWNRQCAAGELVSDSQMPVEFGTFGQPRAIAGLAAGQNFCGGSFAAAHVSALAASFLESHPGADVQKIRQILKTHAERRT